MRVTRNPNGSGAPWSRRRFVGGTAAAVAAAIAGGTRPVHAAGTKILIAGDSMIAGGFGLFLERTLAKDHGFDTVRRGKSSTGLARPDFFNWIKEAKRLVADRVPDVVVTMFGGNDVQGLYMGKGEWIRWHDDGWKEEYARRIVEFCDTVAPGNARVFWVGLPVMRPEKFRRRVERVNTIYRAEMAIRERATFLDTWAVLADADGEYADRIVLEPGGKRVRVRAGDGIHLSPAGAHHLEAHVLTRLLPDLQSA